MLLRLNRQHPPPQLPRLLAKVRRLAEVPPPRPDSLRLEQQVRQRHVAEVIRLAKSAEKGSLKSPYQDFKKVAEEGHQKFMSAGCNGCHGGTGGGGMGPPLTNPVWVYGSDDDTLFRLISLGSDELKKQGYTRKGSENVVGPMPAMGGVLKDSDSLWKVIAWIRSVNPSSAGGGTAPSASATPSGAAPAAPSGALSPAPSAPPSAQ